MLSRWISRASLPFFQVLRQVGWARHEIIGAYLRATVPVKQTVTAMATGRPYSRILIIRLDDIGDFVLTTPLLRAMRKGFPTSRISLLINSTVAPLACRCPHVDEIIQFEIDRTPPPLDQIAALVRAMRFAKSELADRGFECAVIPRADIDNACALAMAYHAGIPVRVGYSECVLPLKRIKNAGYDGFLTHPVTAIFGTHEVEWSLNLATTLGIDATDSHLELWPSDVSAASVSEALSRVVRGRNALVAIAPGANLGRRRWPDSEFAAVARRLIKHQRLGVVIIGGPGDADLGGRIVSAVGAREIENLTGSLSLDQTASVLRQCQLFIGNDSGPMHIAAAMGVPCVEISCHPKDGAALAANSPLRFSPWGVRNLVLQPEHAISPCTNSCVKKYAHCITQITADEVYVSACNLLEKCADWTVQAQ